MVQCAGGFLRTGLCAWALVAVVDCGGESRQVPRGTTGGTGGAGGSGSGAGTGGTGGRGATGGSSTGGKSSVGGSSGRNTAGGTPGVAGRGVAGVSGSDVAGAGGEPVDPFAECVQRPLVDGTTCSFAATCDALECGKPWSLYDENGCARDTCSQSSDCPAGQRCVAAPVAGGTDSCWSSSCESCEPSSGGCSCTCTDDCGVRAVCLPVADAPPENDCSTDGLGCAPLRARLDALNHHLDDAPEGDVGDAILACYQKLTAAEPTICAACEEWLPDTFFGGITAESVLEGWEETCAPGRTMAIYEACDLRAMVLTEGQANVTWVVDAAGRIVGFRQTTSDGSCGLETQRAGVQIDCGFEGAAFCNSWRPRQLDHKQRTLDCDVSTQCRLCEGHTCDVGPLGMGGAAGAAG